MDAHPCTRKSLKYLPSYSNLAELNLAYVQARRGYDSDGKFNQIQKGCKERVVRKGKGAKRDGILGLLLGYSLGSPDADTRCHHNIGVRSQLSNLQEQPVEAELPEPTTQIRPGNKVQVLTASSQIPPPNFQFQTNGRQQ
jgi:hypothetical protein